MKISALGALLFLICAAPAQSASSQIPGATKTSARTMSQSILPKAVVNPGIREVALAAPWPPADVDKMMPSVASTPACSLPEVLAGAGSRIQELLHNVDRFTATEVVHHQNVDASGHLRKPETSRFYYLVSMSQRPNGSVLTDEYRQGLTKKDQFPDQIITQGTPGLVLIFHPQYVSNFAMTCEGLGEWHGQPAWQVRFEQRRDTPQFMVSIVSGSRSFGLRLRGRAWILADSYQVARLETDLEDQVPALRLRLQHQNTEYGPVTFNQGQTQIWLPSSTELFLDFRGYRFYRKHTFTDFGLFSVKVNQEFGDLLETANQ